MSKRNFLGCDIVRKALSIIAVMLMLCLTFIPQAFAKIEFEYKENGSVNYKSTKKLMKWSTVEWFEFVKNIEKNGNESYFIRFGVGTPIRTVADADVFIDGVKTVTKTVELPYSKYTKPKGSVYRPEDTYTFYDVSKQTIEQLANCKKEMYCIFYPKKKEPLVFKVDEDNIKEMQKIISLKHEDWQTVKSGKLEEQEDSK